METDKDLKIMFKTLESEKLSDDFSSLVMRQLLHDSDVVVDKNGTVKKKLLQGVILSLVFLFALITKIWGQTIINKLPNIISIYFSSLFDFVKSVLDIFLKPFGVLVLGAALLLYFVDVFILYYKKIERHHF